MSGKPIEFHDDLIPLPVAARVVYARIYEEKLARPAESFLLQRLDGAAAAIAGITSLYTYEPAQSSAIRRLNVSELRGGTFRNGGNELHYQDGRETLRISQWPATIWNMCSRSSKKVPSPHRALAAILTTVRFQRKS